MTPDPAGSHLPAGSALDPDYHATIVGPELARLVRKLAQQRRRISELEAELESIRNGTLGARASRERAALVALAEAVVKAGGGAVGRACWSGTYEHIHGRPPPARLWRSLGELPQVVEAEPERNAAGRRRQGRPSVRYTLDLQEARRLRPEIA